MGREFFYPTVQGSILETVERIKQTEPKTKAMQILFYYRDRTALDRFCLGAANNPDVPHVFAEYSIIRGLSELIFQEEYVDDPKRWRRVGYERIRTGARQLLQEHTEKLDALGADVRSGLLVGETA